LLVLVRHVTSMPATQSGQPCVGYTRLDITFSPLEAMVTGGTTRRWIGFSFSRSLLEARLHLMFSSNNNGRALSDFMCFLRVLEWLGSTWVREFSDALKPLVFCVAFLLAVVFFSLR